MKFWIKLNWGKLKGRDTKIKQIGPYPTQTSAENAAINFGKWYGAADASAKVVKK